eukprot:CAMPEP_0113594862 /NCGR_PEP_ID=MMETSP0015_2-20120614/39323_1 /TAXON_ID=2838 /ORGANISM="Odontella" /LENGTH=924 /DNA_ID=CAMNT_0000501927 /DNA_START=134 /DNA_END=2909 /DNA_ORIENTATION=+ /assembly_acc=CAM_ASM_000160
MRSSGTTPDYAAPSGLGGASGFAYAPNFITKIVQEETGIRPVGLLDVGGGGGSDDARDADAAAGEGDAGVESSASASASSSSPALLPPVITRFPPEPNGYLHLGHAKAVCFNFAVPRAFSGDGGGGRVHMRLDDTNPSKEEIEYVDSILEDVRWVQRGLDSPGKEDGGEGEDEDEDDGSNNNPWYGPVRHTSDHFELIHDCAVELIKSGDAYVDSLSAEEMREYRGTLTEPGRNSPYRTRSIEENLDMFQKMRKGEYPEGTHVLRAKIDMSSPNINLRDPALYRIKHENHQATGDEWSMYPMYDFSHPIVDAVEGITYSLCTLEFEDHRPFYDWTLDKLIPGGLLSPTDGSRRPRQIEFSRLNVKNTVLSKRKLIQLVTENHVSGWDDPRMPTLSGLRRRGIPPSALRLFCERVGISKADSNIDYSELENCAREIMDASCPRAFAILTPLKVTLKNWQGSVLEDLEIPRHPKFEEWGERVVPFGKNLLIERTDFFDVDGPEGEASNGRPPRGFKRLIGAGGTARLKYAYVIKVEEVLRDSDTQEPTELVCTIYPETRGGKNPEDPDVKKPKGIIQWVESKTAVKCKINQYDRLFKAEEPGSSESSGGDFLKDINPDSLETLEGVLVEPSVAMDAVGILAEMRSAKAAAAENEGGTGETLYHSDLAYQFERSGYFALDKSSGGMDNLIFNRVVTLRDTWGGDASGGKKKQQQSGGQQQRKRGGDGGGNERKRGGGGGGGGGGNGAPLEDCRRVALRAATVLTAGPHPDAESLIVCTVNCGDDDGESRTVVAGLAGKVDLDELVGRKVVCATNLKPAKMRGVESTAMFLAASDGNDGDTEQVELLDVPDGVPNGELLSFEGKDKSEPDAMLKSKGALKAWERVKARLRSNGEGEACFDEEGGENHRIVTGEGLPVTTESLKNAVIQ